jgi:hypothetical protein
MTTLYQHPVGLRQLSKSFTEADCAEQAGHAIGSNCLDAILASQSQAEHCIALTRALLDLQRLAHPDRAAAGFAVSLVSVVEQGLHHA